MKKILNWKAGLAVLAATALFGAGLAVGAAGYGKPKSIIHVVTIKWKDGTTEEQKKAAIAGVEKVAASVPGVKNVWLVSKRVQPVKQYFPDSYMEDAYAIEFENQAAEQAYSKSPERKKWVDELYYPHRERSYSVQVTN